MRKIARHAFHKRIIRDYFDLDITGFCEVVAVQDEDQLALYILECPTQPTETLRFTFIPSNEPYDPCVWIYLKTCYMSEGYGHKTYHFLMSTISVSKIQSQSTGSPKTNGQICYIIANRKPDGLPTISEALNGTVYATYVAAESALNAHSVWLGKDPKLAIFSIHAITQQETACEVIF